MLELCMKVQKHLILLYVLSKFMTEIKVQRSVIISLKIRTFLRYTYGAPVKGTAHLKVKSFEQTDVNQIKEVSTNNQDEL